MKLSIKPEIFCRIFFEFFQSILNFECPKKNEPQGQAFLKLLTPKDVLI